MNFLLLGSDQASGELTRLQQMWLVNEDTELGEGIQSSLYYIPPTAIKILQIMIEPQSSFPKRTLYYIYTLLLDLFDNRKF